MRHQYRLCITAKHKARRDGLCEEQRQPCLKYLEIFGEEISGKMTHLDLKKDHIQSECPETICSVSMLLCVCIETQSTIPECSWDTVFKRMGQMDGHTDGKIMQMSRETLCACKLQLVIDQCAKSYHQRMCKHPTQDRLTKNIMIQWWNVQIISCACSPFYSCSKPKAWKVAIVMATVSPWRGGAVLHCASMAPLKPGNGADNGGERVGSAPESLHKGVLV